MLDNIVKTHHCQCWQWQHTDLNRCSLSPIPYMLITLYATARPFGHLAYQHSATCQPAAGAFVPNLLTQRLIGCDYAEMLAVGGEAAAGGGCPGQYSASTPPAAAAPAAPRMASSAPHSMRCRRKSP